MADRRPQQLQMQTEQPHHNMMQQDQEPRSHQVVKAATAVTAGGSLLVLSGLTLAGTVIALTIATPVMVLFSPVLVPAAITVFLLITGFLASGGFGIAALSLLTWMYKFVTGRQPTEDVEHAKMKLVGKAREMKEKADQQFTHSS